MSFADINSFVIGSEQSVPDALFLDSPARNNFRKKGLLGRVFSPLEKRRVNNDFFNGLLSKLQQHFQLANREVAENLLNYVRHLQSISWSKDDELSIETLNKIVNAFSSCLLYSGNGIFPYRDDSSSEDIKSFVDFMLLRKNLDSSVFTGKNIQAIVVDKDPAILNEFRGELLAALDEAFQSYQKGGVNDFLFSVFVHNIIGLLPFTYPELGMEFPLPVKTGNSWEMRLYMVEAKFDLSPSWFSSPLPAYGLSPKGHGQSILAFIGTTFPAGEGFLAAFLSDCTPGFSVGHAACLYGEKSIREWLGEQGPAKAVGISLGGALTLHAARLFPDLITEAHAIDPPGWYPWLKSSSNAQIKIYSQWNDLISTMGFFPTGENVEVYRILQAEEENFAAAHLRLYSGGGRVAIFKSSPEFENKRAERRFLTALHIATSPITVSIVLPIHFVTKLFKIAFKAATFQYADNPKEMRIVAAVIAAFALSIILVTIGFSVLLTPHLVYPGALGQFMRQIDPTLLQSLAITGIASGVLITAALNYKILRLNISSPAKKALV